MRTGGETLCRPISSGHGQDVRDPGPGGTERIDDLQRGGCRIIQRTDLFCFGMDAVLLSAWAEAKRGERVLDLCSGNGIVPILMDARLPEELRREKSIHFTGVEIQSINVDLARRSALMNGQSERIRFFEGDIRDLFWTGNPGIDVKEALQSRKPGLAECPGSVSDEGCRDLAPEKYDCVTVNPPYMAGNGGLKGPNRAKSIARHEVMCTMDDAAKAASRALRMGGRMYLVHRPHRLGDIFRALEQHALGIRRMKMVHPFLGKEANLVLIEAQKGGKTYVHAEPPLVVYSQPGVYTEELKALYG